MSTDGTDQRAPTSATRARRLPQVGTVEFFFLGAVVGIVARVWLIGEGPPSWWQDSYDYLVVGSSPLWSTDLWAGARPPLASLMIARLGGELSVNYVVFQLVLAGVCWAALAAQVSVGMPTAARRWVAFVVVLGFSLTRPLVLWDRSILSESLGLSLLAAVLASGLWLLRRPGYGRLTLFLVVAASWLMTRDTNAVVVAVLALGLISAAVVGHVRERRGRGSDVGGGGRARGLMLAGAVVLLVLSGFSAWSSAVGGREVLPLTHVYSVRVLPYEDRVQWFAEQGMPDAELFLPPPVPPGAARPTVVGIPLDDPVYDRWRSWLETDGRSTLVRWVLTHPAYLITEPLADPERTFNNGDGDVVTTYAPADGRAVPGLTSLLWLPTIPTVALSIGWFAWYVRRRRRPTPLAVVAAVCLATSAPLAFAAWHSDGMEAARHLLSAGVLLRLGALMAGLSVLEVVAVTPTDPVPGERDGTDPDTASARVGNDVSTPVSEGPGPVAADA